MKIKKIGSIAALCMLSTSLLTGCSFQSAMDTVLGHTEKVTESAANATSNKDVKEVDTSLEAPAFSVNLEGAVTFAIGSEATPLTVEAAVTDGGTVSYQWYRNNMNTSGGGIPVEGQTEASCVPDTSEEGKTYYFVVATNNHDTKVNKATSGIVEVNIVPEGSWVDQDGYKMYQIYDGSFVTSAWKDIDGQTYAFDENGHMRSGWLQEADGSWYYFNPDGTLARDTEIEGYAVGSDGKSDAKAQAEAAAAAAAAQAAADAAAAQAAADAAAAQAAADAAAAAAAAPAQ